MEERRIEVGVNTFGLGKLLAQDFEGTVSQLKEAGFTAIEPLVVFPQALGMPESMLTQRLSASGQLGVFWPAGLAEQRIAYLREAGFRVEGIHLGLVGMVPGGLKQVIGHAAEFAKKTGLSYIVHSPKKSTVKEMEAEAEGFRAAQQVLKPYGIEILFHCHYQEFESDEETTPFAWLMQEIPELKTELDVGWVQFAGMDVMEVMRVYKERIAIIHFKDLTPDACSDNIKNCFAAVGEGTLPFADIMEFSETMNLSYTGYIIDQDNSRGDMIRDLSTGAANIRRPVK